jgi:hypothetical protein
MEHELSQATRMEITAETHGARANLLRRLDASMRLSKDVPPDAGKLYSLKEYFDKVPRAVWAEALQIGAQQNPAAGELLMLLSSSQASDKKIVWLAASLGIEIFQLTEWLKTWYYHFNLLLVQEELFAVVRDIAHDARNREESCTSCGGTGKGSKKKMLCSGCGGTGKVMVQGDRYARRQLGEIGGMLNSKNGLALQVNVNTNTGAKSVDDLLERAQRAQTNNIVAREKFADAIEAEVIPDGV